jgi:uncharacterized sulfatase
MVKGSAPKVVMVVALALLTLVQAASGYTARPNIVLIMADDLGYGDVASYPNPTSSRLLTPHLDRFATEGLKFTENYAGYSVCAPSRQSLMTGIHSGHFQATQMEVLPANTTTIATLLSNHGYDTAIIGKWGLDGSFKTGPRPPTGGFPLLHGFNFFMGQTDQWQCHNYYPSFQFDQWTNMTIEVSAFVHDTTTTLMPQPRTTSRSFHARKTWALQT